MHGTPLARHREPWETIGKSKEALDAAQWERMQTGRLSEHFWAKSDYVRRGAARRGAAPVQCSAVQSCEKSAAVQALQNTMSDCDCVRKISKKNPCGIVMIWPH